ncbi:hypothetical protein RBU49_06835 [Clostridium sp. MB40-C1]|nr:hypothetical protein [Clostridium sp. MB40-C1]WMJ81958.1 hypothetical protein RBU49_06835 [Clostridium sp. MB40-C1]
MKILIMSCSNKNLWYSNKIGKTYEVKKQLNSSYLTKDGGVSKEDAEVIK